MCAIVLYTQEIRVHPPSSITPWMNQLNEGMSHEWYFPCLHMSDDGLQQHN